MTSRRGRDWFFERKSLIQWKKQMKEMGTSKHRLKPKTLSDSD